MSQMTQVVFARAFRWSPDGYTVLAYDPGPAEVPARCAEVAAQAGALEAETRPAPKKAQPKAKAKK